MPLTSALALTPNPNPNPGDLAGGAMGLVPVGIDAMSPTIAGMVSSLGGSSMRLTANETARLLYGAAKVGVALADGDFSAVIRIVAELGGLPPSAVASIEKVLAGELLEGGKGLTPHPKPQPRP